MTQKERVHKMLKDAGPKGVRSDEFFREYMPRAAARIMELKAEGVEIETEREGKFVRYTLAGVDGRGPESRDQGGEVGAPSGPRPLPPAVDSGESLELFPETPYERMQDAA